MEHVPYLITVVSYSAMSKLVGTEGNYPSSTWVGLLDSYLARILVTLSSKLYKDGQGPTPKQSTSKAIQITTQDVGYYAPCDPNLSKSLCSFHLQVPDLGDTPT
jgi:hypothetical protein